MRTEILPDAAVIMALSRVEDYRRAAARARMIATVPRPKRHQRYTVAIGRRFIQIGERLQVMAKQPA